MNRDHQWSLRVEGGVLVVEFPHGTVLSPAEGDALLERWLAAAADGDVEAAVLVVRTSRSCSDAGRGALRKAAQAGVTTGITRWAVVAERPKRRYLKRTIDVAGVDVEAFNDIDAGLAWAGRRRTRTT